jgi:uncharacterized protein
MRHACSEKPLPSCMASGHEKYNAAHQMREYAKSAFSPKSCMYHYLNMAKGNYREYLQGDFVKIKKYFYVLRPIFACEWIERYNTMPPMSFDELVETILPKGELESQIKVLLERKRAGDEMDKESKVQGINDYIAMKIDHFEQVSPSLQLRSEQIDETLDSLFRDSLDEVWGNSAN